MIPLTLQVKSTPSQPKPTHWTGMEMRELCSPPALRIQNHVNRLSQVHSMQYAFPAKAASEWIPGGFGTMPRTSTWIGHVQMCRWMCEEHVFCVSASWGAATKGWERDQVVNSGRAFKAKLAMTNSNILQNIANIQQTLHGASMVKSEGSQVLFLRVSLFHRARHGHPLTGMAGAYRRSLFVMTRIVMDCHSLYQHVSFFCFPTSWCGLKLAAAQSHNFRSLQGNFQVFEVVFV